MSQNYPQSIDGLALGEWETYREHYEELVSREINNTSSQAQWLQDWSHVTRLIREAMSHIHIQKSLDTRDRAAEQLFIDLVNNVIPNVSKLDQTLKEKLITLDIQDPNMAVPLRDLRDAADLFKEENIPVHQELMKTATGYDKITGGLSTEYNGETQNLNQISTDLDSKDRAIREKAWHAVMGLWQSQREELNELFLKLLPLRNQIAENAGVSDYREYAFRERRRFDYTPKECFDFHEAIEKAVVPAAQRIMEEKRKSMGADSLKPWDWVPDMGKVVDISGQELQPFTDQADLIKHSRAIFDNLDPRLGRYFHTMADNDLLDLDTRAGKSLGGYCTSLPLRGHTFIFMNSTGTSGNVQTLLHEAGHAFHGFEAMNSQPLVWQMRAPMEFNEVASMAMESLAAPYLTAQKGGFYKTNASYALHRKRHLEKVLLFFPYMAVVDAFQHWVYTNPVSTASALDAKWDEIWQRFLPSVDWTGYEHIRESGWHRKLHIFRSPFYYIEYGMAQVGALQVWRNSLSDHAQALADYKHALSLGGTKILPELFEAAGAEFRFDVPMLTGLVTLIEENISELNQQINN